MADSLFTEMVGKNIKNEDEKDTTPTLVLADRGAQVYSRLN